MSVIGGARLHFHFQGLRPITLFFAMNYYFKEVFIKFPSAHPFSIPNEWVCFTGCSKMLSCECVVTFKLLERIINCTYFSVLCFSAIQGYFW